MNMTSDFFKVAAFRLEQHYMGADNSYILTMFDTPEVDAFELPVVESMLVDYIEANLDLAGENVSIALFALGKTVKPIYRPLYIVAMQKSVRSDLNICYQAGIAIENLGENIFDSISPTEDPQLSTERANEFLSANGKYQNHKPDVGKSSQRRLC